MKRRLTILATLAMLAACTVAVPAGTVSEKRVEGDKYYITLKDSQRNDQEHEVSRKVFRSVKIGDSYQIK